MKSLHPGGDEQIRQLCKHFAALAESYNDVNFTQPYLGKIEARTLIMSGDDDPYFTPKMQLEMQTSIPVSSLWIVPDGGHLPHLNMTEEFLIRSMRFMREE